MKMMRLGFILLLSVLFTSVSFAGILHAQGARNESPKKDSPQKSPSPLKRSKRQSDLLAAKVTGGAEDRLIVDLKPDTPDSLENGNSNSCAFMRTYRVKRQARGSDAVAPAGYTTCVPTRRFEMRTAVQTSTDSGREK